MGPFQVGATFCEVELAPCVVNRETVPLVRRSPTDTLCVVWAVNIRQCCCRKDFVNAAGVTTCMRRQHHCYSGGLRCLTVQARVVSSGTVVIDSLGSSPAIQDTSNPSSSSMIGETCLGTALERTRRHRRCLVRPPWQPCHFHLYSFRVSWGSLVSLRKH